MTVSTHTMTLTGLLLRFALLYPPALLAAGLAVHALGLGAGGPAVNMAILFGLIAYLLNRFGARNRRYLSPIELRNAFFGLFGINLLYQVLFGLVLTDRFGDANAGAIAVGLAIVSILHGAAIYLALRLMRKNLEQRGVIPPSSPARPG